MAENKKEIEITAENVINRAKEFIGWLEATGLVKSEFDRQAILKALVDQYKALYYDVSEEAEQKSSLSKQKEVLEIIKKLQRYSPALKDAFDNETIAEMEEDETGEFVRVEELKNRIEGKFKCANCDEEPVEHEGDLCDNCNLPERSVIK